MNNPQEEQAQNQLSGQKQQKKKQAGQEQQQDMNQLLKIRRDKLAQLQEQGSDPFRIERPGP